MAMSIQQKTEQNKSAGVSYDQWLERFKDCLVSEGICQTRESAEEQTSNIEWWRDYYDFDYTPEEAVHEDYAGD